MLAHIVEESYVDPAGDEWHRLELVSRATRKTGADFIIESLYKEMEKAGDINQLLKKHQEELAGNNTEWRRKYLKFKKKGCTRAREQRQNPQHEQFQ